MRHRPGLYQMGTSVVGGGWGHHGTIHELFQRINVCVEADRYDRCVGEGGALLPAESM